MNFIGGYVGNICIVEKDVLVGTGADLEECQKEPDSPSACEARRNFGTLWLFWNPMERVPKGSRGLYR